jgi:signal transduction histidine kinase
VPAGDGWPDDPKERLSKLTHDLRTPLAVVIGFAELLERRADLPAEQRSEFVDRMVSSAREMLTLLDDERASRRIP